LEGEKKDRAPSVKIMVSDLQDSCLIHMLFRRVLSGLKKISSSLARMFDEPRFGVATDMAVLPDRIGGVFASDAGDFSSFIIELIIRVAGSRDS